MQNFRPSCLELQKNINPAHSGGVSILGPICVTSFMNAPLGTVGPFGVTCLRPKKQIFAPLYLPLFSIII